MPLFHDTAFAYFCSRISKTRVNRLGDVEKASCDTDHVNLVEWGGPDDAENPLNWSSWKKAWVAFQICLLSWAIFVGGAIYSAGVDSVEEDFHITEVEAILGLTMYVLGNGVGVMFWSPITEIPQIGRNPVYLGTLLLFLLLQIPTALATNLAMLLIFRFITGFIGSPSLAAGGASLGDMYPPRKKAYAITWWDLAALCGPALGPLIGGYAVQAAGWRWTMWELMAINGAVLVLLVYFLPETSAANILFRRARRIRLETGDRTYQSQGELDSADLDRKEVFREAMIRPFLLNAEPIVLALNIYVSLVYALQYIWLESFPIVFGEVYGMTLGVQGFTYLSIAIGALIAIPPFFWHLRVHVEPQFDQNGEMEPEARLIAAVVGSFFIPVNCILTYLADVYPRHTASVLAGNELMRSAFAAGFPLFAPAMYHQLGIAWASSLLAFLACAFVPLPFLLRRYGKRLRLASKNAGK
ncbi:GTPase-activating protein [Elasticomyces elasticus]|nr:GTPase-activating protein [Elasticomyces elasticus]